jgi:hypothetical protein
MSYADIKRVESEQVLRITAALYDLAVTERPRRERLWWRRFERFSVRLEIAKRLEDSGVLR